MKVKRKKADTFAARWERNRGGEREREKEKGKGKWHSDITGSPKVWDECKVCEKRSEVNTVISGCAEDAGDTWTEVKVKVKEVHWRSKVAPKQTVSEWQWQWWSFGVLEEMRKIGRAIKSSHCCSREKVKGKFAEGESQRKKHFFSFTFCASSLLLSLSLAAAAAFFLSPSTFGAFYFLVSARFK